MYRSNGHITTYFKPSNHTPPCQNKCHSSEHTLEGPRAIRRLASGVAGQGQTERQKCLNNEQLAQGLDVHTMAAGSGNSSQQWPLHQHAKSDDNSPLSSQHDKSPQDKSSEMPFVPSLYEPRSRSFEISGSKRPILASSQRMVKNGEVIIKNSDEESHSDTSLEDLDNLLGSRKPSERESLTYPKPELSRLSSRSKKDGDYMNTRRRTRESAHTDEAFPLRPDLPVQRKKYRFSLESLAKERKQEEAFKENIAQANTMAKSLVQKRKRIDENGRLRTETVGLGADIIDTIMKDHGDDGDIGRLKTAIQRTEALHLSKSWSFFDSHSEVSLSEQEKFPSIGDGRIERLFGGTSSRQQAFLSGYIGEYALKETLPDDVLLWIMDAICVEPRDDLRYSYIATLTNAEKQFTSLLSPNLIDVLFRKLGAHAPALDHERPIVPYAVLSQGNVSFDRPGLLSLLGLIRGVARGMASESRIHMIRVLCRLAIDQSIVNSWHAMNAIENLFASLSEAVPNEDSELEVQCSARAKRKCANLLAVADSTDHGIPFTHRCDFTPAIVTNDTCYFPFLDSFSATIGSCILLRGSSVFNQAAKCLGRFQSSCASPQEAPIHRQQHNRLCSIRREH